MTPTIIIPARFASSRLPGKPLQMMGGKSLLQWTWEAASETGWPVWIATDDEEIQAVAQDFGAGAIMTSGLCRNGTERCAEAVRRLDLDGVIVNWQGDAPLTPVSFAQRCVACLESMPWADVATPAMLLSPESEAKHRDMLRAGSSAGVTVSVTRSGDALYFSRSPIPYRGPLRTHVGLYAYRLEALQAYCTDVSVLEVQEGLEQLRFLEIGASIHVCDMPEVPLWEVNEPRDVQIVSEMLSRRHEAA